MVFRLTGVNFVRKVPHHVLASVNFAPGVIMTALLWQKAASDIPSKSELLMFS